MSLKTELQKIQPRETGGSIAGSRFDFQKDWSLCKLIELHLLGKDYLLIFEFHEDLIQLNSESDPTKISFYQIKTATKSNWTIDSLLSKEKKESGSSFSFLGKLYTNKIKFPGHTESLNFISNIPYKVKLKGGKSPSSKVDVCIDECDDTEIKRISDALIKEHSLGGAPEFSQITFLKNANLHLSDSATHTKGKITTFIDNYYPKKNYKTDLIYKTLIDEIKKRSSVVLENADFVTLIKKKGISRAMFDEIIKSMGFDSDFDVRWSTISQRLNTDKESIFEIDKIHQQWKLFEVNLMDQTNTTNTKFCEFIKESVKLSLSTKKEVNVLLKDFLNAMVDEYKKSNSSTNYPEYPSQYIKVVILWSMYE